MDYDEEESRPHKVGRECNKRSHLLWLGKAVQRRCRFTGAGDQEEML
jgi:hypothetical protein